MVNTRHGMKDTPTYNSWHSMHKRCNNPARPYYGSEGVKVCERWRWFVGFLADMGMRPEGTTLDRWPNCNGNYEPGNCRWATPSEQASNRRDNFLLEFEGRRLCLSEWARVTGIRRGTIAYRLKIGWPAARALTAPLMPPADRNRYPGCEWHGKRQKRSRAAEASEPNRKEES